MRSTQRRGQLAVAVACTVLVWCPSVFALDPALDVSQYAHTAWRVREGFTKGPINSIAQSPDGYLWLATELGMIRFDGVRTTPWQPPADQRLPSNRILRLLVTRDGALWIGTDKGLARWKGGELTHYAQLAGFVVPRIIEDREGLVWVSGLGVPTGRLCVIRAGNTQCEGDDGRFGIGVMGLYEDTKRTLWATVSNGIWRWKPDPPEFHPMPGEYDSMQSFIEDDGGALLTSARNGIRRLVDGRAEAYPLPATKWPFGTNGLLRDREGALWIGTSNHGLVHVHRGRTDVFTPADGLSGDSVNDLFEDREGNIWVATVNGLDRFRELAVATLATGQGLSTARVSSVLATRDGSVLLGTSDGLNRWTDGQIEIARTGSAKPNGMLNGNSPFSLFQDHGGRIWVSTISGIGYLEGDRYTPIRRVPGGNAVHSIAEDTQGNVWFALQKDGLFSVSRDGTTQEIPWGRLNRKDFAYSLAFDPLRGGLWMGFYQSGVAFFINGEVRASIGVADGLGAGRVAGLLVDPDGTVWAATEGGLSRLKDGRVATLTSKNGLPCDAVHWIIKDNAQAFWLYMPCGLIRVARSELDAWATANQESGVTRRVRTTVLDNSDGVSSVASAAGFSPLVAKSAEGRLWFRVGDGVSTVDPDHLSFNKLAPPVRIEQVTADRTTHDADSAVSQPLRLPPLTRDLQIDYTALSLVAPEKNQFKIKLEGRDREWQDVGTRRQAYYNDLSPRSYRFRVIASNNSGVWNETGASLEFSIAPAYYQTTTFRAAVVIGALGFLWGLHQVRLRRIAYEFDARLQARVNERARIARDLHDTLLQSFHGVLFRFQAATNQLPDRPAEAKQQFERAIDCAAQAITEGRDAVQNLRLTVVETTDLAIAIGTLGEELAADHANDPNSKRPIVTVSVEGTPRNLHPILRDDIFRIAGEALRNAFRHARARRIEVQIHYDDQQLQIRVRDDGEGIDRAAMDDERPGHFGLPGMRERAEIIGGHLEVWSEAGLGVEVDLKVPAAAAYATPRATGRLRSWLFARKTGGSS